MISEICLEPRMQNASKPSVFQCELVGTIFGGCTFCSLVWMLPPLDFRADRPQEVAVAFRLLRQIRPAAFTGSHLVVLFQLEFVRNIRN